MSQERPEERFAFAVVGSVLPVTVEPYDRCERQRAVDAILHYPDGRTGALEVSSIGPDDEAAIMNYLDNRGHCKSIAGLNRRWLVQIPRDFHPADMRKIDMVLPWCEARERILLLTWLDAAGASARSEDRSAHVPDPGPCCMARHFGSAGGN